mmetsp:Transcript_61729/g.145467  ORF Transcript_61729/g.145467 Transcript_61729/m.145467 type:complete len:180 (+) Transcript_61729:54-593(+)
MMARTTVLACVCVAALVAESSAFAPALQLRHAGLQLRSQPQLLSSRHVPRAAKSIQVKAELDDNTAGILGGVGVVSSGVMLWSEYTLKTTGCGLPAGPGGALGALEGISYLVVVGLVGFSVFTKVKTGKGLPAGPGGLLGAAEGLGFLAVLAGVVVLGFQVADYGYIPNAVPTEGGKCA